MIPAEAGPPRLRLASYNIQKCVGMDLRRRPDRIMSVLDRIGASVVVLQEADKRLPPRPAALPHFTLGESGWSITDLGGAGSLGWHGNAIIWRDAGVSVRGTGHIDLPGLEPRGAVWAAFDTPIGPLRVIGMHLGLVRFYRHQQLLQVAREMKALPPMPTVWAGDVNEWSHAPGLDRLTPGMRFLEPLPTYPAPRPVGPLDRIALGQGLGCLGHGVFDLAPARMASDHLPLWADLSAATDAGGIAA